MPEEPTVTSELLRLSRELMLAEIGRFYAASKPIAFQSPEAVEHTPDSIST